MEAAEHDINELDAILADFTNRLRLGDAPPVDDFLARHPAQADELRELLPIIAATESLKSKRRSKRSRGNGETPSFFLNGDTAPAADAIQVKQPSFQALAFLDTVFSPPEGPDEIGRIGSYRVLELLGRGGMGAVFLAEDVRLHRQVALKVMLPDVAGQMGADERFLREARAAARLEHDNIVTIYQVDIDRGVPFLAMALLRGRSLEDRIASGPPPMPLEIVRIGRQVADGLAAAHARGIIHRDIKPANIWLEERSFPGSAWERTAPQAPPAENESASTLSTSGDGENNVPNETAGGACGAVRSQAEPGSERVKLLDFGLARPVSLDASVTQSGAVVGTPAYMSPEQARGETMDGRADLFSLGVVLYRLSTGKLPFPGSNAASVLMALGAVTPASPAAVGADVPEPLSDLIMSMLAKKADQRPPSALAVSHRLREIEDALLHPVPLKAAPVPRTSARRWIVPTAVVAAVAIIAILTAAFVQSPSPNHPETVKNPDAAPAQQPEPWRPLFNGKDLAGWQYPPQLPGDWIVEDGQLVGRGRPGWLYSDEEFSNFHLLAEMKLSPFCDTGIFFWTPLELKHFPDGRLNPVSWHEVNLNRRKKFGNLGSLDGQNVISHLAEVPLPREWITVEVIAEARTVAVMIDGRLANKVEFPEALRGHIALQTPLGPDAAVWIRRIDIKSR